MALVINAIVLKEVPSQSYKVENFVIYDIKGNRYLFYDLFRDLPKDGVVILNFTSIYCRPCKKEIPELVNIAKNAGAKAILLFIYAEHGGLARDNASNLGIKEHAYVDPFGNIRKQFDVKLIPVTFIIGKDYSLKSRIDGYSDKNMNRIQLLISAK